jgi:hypothetical protein
VGDDIARDALFTPGNPSLHRFPLPRLTVPITIVGANVVSVGTGGVVIVAVVAVVAVVVVTASVIPVVVVIADIGFAAPWLGNGKSRGGAAAAGTCTEV